MRPRHPTSAINKRAIHHRAQRAVRTWIQSRPQPTPWIVGVGRVACRSAACTCEMNALAVVAVAMLTIGLITFLTTIK